MVKFLLKTADGGFDFENPIDIEMPNMELLKSLLPTTEVYLVDFNKDQEIKFQIKKDIMLVVKSILAIYPRMFFALNPKFFEDKVQAMDLLKTSLRTIEVRAKSDAGSKDLDIKDFEARAQAYIQSAETTM